MRAASGAACLALAVVLGACVPDAAASIRESPAGGPDTPDAEAGYVELGDIDRIRERGLIRFANVARAELEELPRLRWGMPSEDRLAREFADRMGLDLIVQHYPSEDSAQAALLEGRVDGIVGRSGPGIAPPTDGITYSVPFTSMPGVLVGRAGDLPDSLPGLAGRGLTLASPSALLGFADSLQAVEPALAIDTADVATVVDVMDRIRADEVGLTLAERWIAEAVVSVDTSLAIGEPFGEIVYTAAVRSSNPDLLRLVNDFRFAIAAAGEDGGEHFGDLPEIRERGVLRVLTARTARPTTASASHWPTRSTCRS